VLKNTYISELPILFSSSHKIKIKTKMLLRTWTSLCLQHSKMKSERFTLHPGVLSSYIRIHHNASLSKQCSHGNHYEQHGLLDCNARKFEGHPKFMNSRTFSAKQETSRSRQQVQLLTMEATCSSKTLGSLELQSITVQETILFKVWTV
jgi:hypothetical protein